MRFSIIGLFLFAACCCNRPYRPEAGDLLFQVTSASDFTDAITEVTSGRQGIPYSHVAIVVRTREGMRVLEAVPGEGVRLITFDRFLDNSARRGGRPLLMAARLRERHLSDGACRRALALVGRPYDAAFMPGDQALYCSELVQVCFLDGEGNPLFASRPMNFRDSTGQIAPYWLEHYARLGLPVPQDVPGTNPGALSRDPQLRVVYSYF